MDRQMRRFRAQIRCRPIVGQIGTDVAYTENKPSRMAATTALCYAAWPGLVKAASVRAVDDVGRVHSVGAVQRSRI